MGRYDEPILAAGGHSTEVSVFRHLTVEPETGTIQDCASRSEFFGVHTPCHELTGGQIVPALPVKLARHRWQEERV
jgi:hypothetical protein